MKLSICGVDVAKQMNDTIPIHMQLHVVAQCHSIIVASYYSGLPVKFTTNSISLPYTGWSQFFSVSDADVEKCPSTTELETLQEGTVCSMYKH